MQNQPGKSVLRYELQFLQAAEIKAQKKERSLPFCLGYDRSHNSLFVTVFFGNSKRLFINNL